MGADHQGVRREGDELNGGAASAVVVAMPSPRLRGEGGSEFQRARLGEGGSPLTQLNVLTQLCSPLPAKWRGEGANSGDASHLNKFCGTPALVKM
jgi:hypothetical protein